MKKILLSVSVWLVLIVPAIAQVDRYLWGPSAINLENSRWYVKAGFGAGIVQDVTITQAGSAAVRVPIEFDPGLSLDLAGGVELSSSVSMELNTGLAFNEVRTIGGFGSPTTVGGVTISGRVDLYQIPIMASLVWTCPGESKWKPFLGAGVGGVYSFVDVGGSVVSSTSGATFSANDGDFVFGFQGLAGLRYKLNDRTEIGFQYRFLGTLDHTFFGQIKTDEIFTHSVMFSAKFVF